MIRDSIELSVEHREKVDGGFGSAIKTRTLLPHLATLEALRGCQGRSGVKNIAGSFETLKSNYWAFHLL